MAVCFAIDESAAKNGSPTKVDYEVLRGAGAAAGPQATPDDSRGR
jgi:hypothetical protein